MDINTKCAAIAVNSIIYDKSIELPIDADFTLPDYCPEINKLLKCNAKVRIFNKSSNEQIITIDGNICVSILYSDENCEACSYEYMLPFNKSIDAGTEIADGIIICKANTEYLNCRVVSKRKVEIHGASGIAIKVHAKHYSNVICDAQGAEVKTDCGTLTTTTQIGSIEKNLIIEEELNIGQQPAVKNIIRYDANTVINESKIIGNKAVVKGEFVFFMLYSHDNSTTLHNYEQTLPFSQIIEIENLTEDCQLQIDCEIINLELNPRTAPDGCFTNFIVCSKLSVNVKAYCDNDVNIVFDAYSTKYDTKLKSENICFEKIIKKINDNFICAKKFEFSDGDVENIIDIWSDHSRFTSAFDGNNFIVSGTVIVCILAHDSSNNTVYHERPVDYEYKFNIDDVNDDVNFDPNITAQISGYSLIGANGLDVKVQMNISAYVFSCHSINVLTDISVCERENCTKSDAAIYIYYAEKGEKLWNIARHYNSSKEEIMLINDLKEEEILNSKAIIIPVC